MTAHLLAGVALVVAGWLIPRRVARARWRLDAALLLDAAPALLAGALLLLATGRPAFAGLVILALGGGLALADHTIRATLREPVMFSAAAELPQLFTHPWLYLPFAGTATVLGAAAVAFSLGLTLLVTEPAAMPPQPLLASLALGVVAGGAWAVGRPPALAMAAALIRRLQPSGDPFADAARLGPFNMLGAHGIIARAERPARRSAFPAPATAALEDAPARPVILVQCESFFDARRLASVVPADFLPGFAECCSGAALFGRLQVPGWGANTMRAEFAVLSGIADEALGYDRFNPYFGFARAPVASQVWRLRQAGYRTICLHPFDRRFYRRDLVMPALGFDCFLGRESLGGPRAPPYAADPDFARQILAVLDEAGPRTFIFAITMGNHGPWLDKARPVDEDLARLVDVVRLPQGGELLRYLHGLRRSDEMLGLLIEGLRRRTDDGLLAFYGDHLPSLPQAFAALGFAEPHSDYAIWPAGGRAQRRDLRAHQLGRVIVDDLLAPQD